jgi:hypothetical protein
MEQNRQYTQAIKHAEWIPDQNKQRDNAAPIILEEYTAFPFIGHMIVPQPASSNVKGATYV